MHETLTLPRHRFRGRLGRDRMSIDLLRNSYPCSKTSKTSSRRLTSRLRSPPSSSPHSGSSRSKSRKLSTLNHRPLCLSTPSTRYLICIFYKLFAYCSILSIVSLKSASFTESAAIACAVSLAVGTVVALGRSVRGRSATAVPGTGDTLFVVRVLVLPGDAPGDALGGAPAKPPRPAC